jgi:hypothetical protein
MIASPFALFSADHGHGFPIGSTYEVIDPARLAYWDPSIEIPETTSTRRAMACPWSPPSSPAVEISADEIFAAMFGDSQP